MSAIDRLHSKVGVELYSGVIPRQKLIDPALLMAVDDGSERGG
jgi:hypothetical protein